MTMHLTHPDAPGHVADASEYGWACSCGAGTGWPDGERRPRSRATGGARRHLTAAARNRPDNSTPAPVEAPEQPRDEDAAFIRQAAAAQAAPAPHDEMTQEQKVEAARASLVAEFRSPPGNANDN